MAQPIVQGKWNSIIAIPIFWPKLRLICKHTHLGLPFAVKLQGSCLPKCTFLLIMTNIVCIPQVPTSSSCSPHKLWSLVWKAKIQKVVNSFLHWKIIHPSSKAYMEFSDVFFSLMMMLPPLPSDLEGQGKRALSSNMQWAEKSQEVLGRWTHNFKVKYLM